MGARPAALASLAAENVAAHALALAAASACLCFTLALWIAGTAVAEGLRAEALRAAEQGPDVVLAARALGRHAPIELALADELRTASGVLRVEARIAGALDVDGRPVLVAGVEPQRFAAATGLARGAAPRGSGECLAGAELARELGLREGSHVALEGALTRVYAVSGIFSGDDALAGSRALVVELAEAQALFGDARAGDLCIWTRAGYAEAVARAAERLRPGLVATTRAQTRAALEHAANRASGAWSALLAPVLALATAAFAALAWFAHARRASEIAAYKLCGFSGGDILWMCLVENALVALLVGCTAFLAAWVFVRVCGAPLLAAYFVPDLALFPAQRVPAAFTPLPLGLGLGLALGATLTGSIFATWRLAQARTTSAFA